MPAGRKRKTKIGMRGRLRNQIRLQLAKRIWTRDAGYGMRPAHTLNIWTGEAVHAEGVGNLATVVDIMLDDVPDDPSAGVGIDLAFPLILDSRLQICERIASQHLLHDLPGFFPSAHQLIRRAW